MALYQIDVDSEILKDERDTVSNFSEPSLFHTSSGSFIDEEG